MSIFLSLALVSRYLPLPYTFRRSKSYFSIPFARTNFVYHSFFLSAFHFYNSLPPSIVSLPSVVLFKHATRAFWADSRLY